MCRAENICNHLGYPGEMIYLRNEEGYSHDGVVTLAYAVLKKIGLSNKQIFSGGYLESVASRTGNKGKPIKVFSIAHPHSRLNDITGNKRYVHER